MVAFLARGRRPDPPAAGSLDAQKEKANEPKLIRTERGAGYFLDTTVETV